MWTLIENGDLLAPEPLGRQSLLIVGNRIAYLGTVESRLLQALPLEGEVIDASGCFVTPGLIDPHQHLLGGSGEKGFASQTPEITLAELVEAGITSVVGCLGVDTTTKSLAGLLARVKGINEEGLSAFLYSGGYNVPPTTLTGSLRTDLLFINEVIGAGEIAISDRRSTHPDPRELARLVAETYVGGLLSGKAGVTHFHVGDGKENLSPLRTLLSDYEIEPEWLYATHVERNEPLMREAIAITRARVAVDIDTMEEDLPKWLKLFDELGGDWSYLTVSSDAAISAPATLTGQLRTAVQEHGFPMERILQLSTSHPARILSLPRKGELKAGNDADILLWRRNDLELREVISRGKRVLREGRVTLRPKALRESNRRVELVGAKT